MNFAAVRLDYLDQPLDESSVLSDPIAQFTAWMQQAIGAGIREPNAMTLATADANGRPSARIVLLKGVDADGFVFYTNYESRKGRDLEANPFAELVFFWAALERQVRIHGAVSRVAAAESDAYFESRPRAAQIGAIGSRQSATLGSRQELEKRIEELAAQFENAAPSRPPSWGGYRVTPETIEFWQGRPSRLHDRVQYVLAADGAWRIRRLSP